MNVKITTRKAVVGYAAEYQSGLPFYAPYSSRTRYGLTREQAKNRLERALELEVGRFRRQKATTRDDSIDIGVS